MHQLSLRTVLLGTAIGLSMADIALRMILLGIDAGAIEVAHDPGKHFFHLVILPFVILLLTGPAPAGITSNLRGITRNGAHAALVLLLGCAVVFTYNESVDSFSQRLTTPEDIRDGLKRATLQDSREKLWSEVRLEVVSSEDASRTARTLAQNLLSLHATGPIAFFRESSPRRWVASLEALLANAVCMYTFWLVLIVPLAGRALSETGRKFFLATIGALTMWIPLKIYSELHHNFGFFPVDDSAILAASALSVVCILLVFVFRSESIIFTIGSGVAAVLAAISSGVIGAFPASLAPFVTAIPNAKPFAPGAVYTFVCAAAASYSVFVYKQIYPKHA